jgi:hypothetical protein
LPSAVEGNIDGSPEVLVLIPTDCFSQIFSA